MTVFLDTLISLFPLYFFIGLGALLRAAKVIPESIIRPLNQLVFTVFISTALFISTYDTDLGKALNLGAILFGVSAVVLQAVGGVLYAFYRVKSRPQAAVLAQCAYRSNFNLHGLIYVGLLYGTDYLGITGILIAVLVPIFNLLSVIIFETFSGQRPSIRSILRRLATNPIILAVLLALFFKLAGLHLPRILYLPLDQIAQAAGPLALLVAGASLSFMGLQSNRPLLIRIAVMRLLLVPLLFVPPALGLGFRGATLLSLLVAFGGPVASPLPAMAYSMGGDGELASQAVAVTSLISLVTLHFFISLLRWVNLL